MRSTIVSTGYVLRKNKEKDGELIRAMYGKIQGYLEHHPESGGKTALIRLKYSLNLDYTRKMASDPNRNRFKVYLTRSGWG